MSRHSLSIVAFAAALIALAPAATAILGLSVESPTDVTPPKINRGYDHPVGQLMNFRDYESPGFDAADDGDYNVQFQCPALIDSSQGYACPNYVLDVEDIMSQPALLVDPRDPNLISFHALHGGLGVRGPGDEPPNARSRDDYLHQPHTLFWTVDGGSKTWNDNRYYSPMHEESAHGSLADKRIFGLDNAATLDGDGNQYLASLYAFKDVSEPTFHYTVALWKARTINRPVDYNSGLSTKQPMHETGAIDNLHLAYVPGAERVVALWREERNATAPSSMPVSTLRIFTTETGGRSGWDELATNPRIAPCDAISNPIALEAKLLVGCRSGKRNESGDPFALYEIDVRTGAVVPLPAVAGAHEDNLVLARTYGRGLVAAGAKLVDGRTSLEFTQTDDPRDGWQDTADVGQVLTSQPSDSPLQLASSRVTALAWSPLSGFVHLFLHEQLERTTADPGAFAQPSHNKTLAVLDLQGNYVTHDSMRIGAPNTRIHFDPEYAGAGEGAFDDLHDSILFIDTDAGVREYVAFGDYGFVRFAEVVEIDVVPFAIPFSGTTPPIPVASPGLNPATIAATAGVLSLAAVSRMLASKKKTKVEAPSL